MKRKGEGGGGASTHREGKGWKYMYSVVCHKQTITHTLSQTLTHTHTHTLTHSHSYTHTHTQTDRQSSLTSDVESDVLVVNLLRVNRHLQTTTRLLPLLATGLGHQLMAAVVDIDPTGCALLALFHQPVQQGATVLAPGGVQVGGGSELVGYWVLCIGYVHVRTCRR